MTRWLLLAAPAALGLALALAPAATRAQDSLSRFDDYPTSARADYVFACMSANGGTQEALRRCACSIDVIAAALPYDKYEAAEAVLRMRQMPGGGYLAGEFRVQATNALVDVLREAQAEAEVRCF